MSVSLDVWQQMAFASADRSTVAQQDALCRALEASTGAFDVWRARDNVQTALHRFESAAGRPLIRRPGALMRIHRATERAGLAVFARDALTDAEFTEMVGAFSALLTSATSSASTIVSDFAPRP